MPLEIIARFVDAERLLYHYTSAPTAIEHIMRARSLRLSRYLGTNDPKEATTWLFSTGTNENRDLGQYKMRELSEWLSSELKRKTRLACFSMDRVPLTGNHLEDISSRGFCKPRMWAQYAAVHAGVCLVFDRQKLQRKIEERVDGEDLVLSGPVHYANRGVLPNLADQAYCINIDYFESVGPKAYVRAHILTHHRQLFFEKMMDWRDESEFRWVVFAHASEEFYVDLGDSLVSIVFGERTDDSAIEALMTMTESWDISYIGLRWRNSGPWYDFGNPRYWSGAGVRH